MKITRLKYTKEFIRALISQHLILRIPKKMYGNLLRE